MATKNKRYVPFTSNHDWTDNCIECHTQHHRPGFHCRKCGISRIMAENRSNHLDVNACPVRVVGTCQKCLQLNPISTESSVEHPLCLGCQYPHSIHCNTAEEALKIMQDINAGIPPNSPNKKQQNVS